MNSKDFTTVLKIMADSVRGSYIIPYLEGDPEYAQWWNPNDFNVAKNVQTAFKEFGIPVEVEDGKALWELYSKYHQAGWMMGGGSVKDAMDTFGILANEIIDKDFTGDITAIESILDDLEKEKSRTRGFYWVKRQGVETPEPARWDGTRWSMIGSEKSLVSGDLDSIGYACDKFFESALHNLPDDDVMSVLHYKPLNAQNSVTVITVARNQDDSKFAYESIERAAESDQQTLTTGQHLAFKRSLDNLFVSAGQAQNSKVLKDV